MTTPSDSMGKHTPTPVAWLHTLDATEGLPENVPYQRLTFGSVHPFGFAGEDYSEEFLVTTEALYSAVDIGRRQAVVTAAKEALDCVHGSHAYWEAKGKLSAALAKLEGENHAT